MQRSGTPRHKARDFKTNLVLIALPLVVLWSFFCYLTISNAMNIHRNSDYLVQTNLPYIRNSFQADYALSNIAYKVEIMSRTTNKDLLRDYYLRALEIINDPELSHNKTIGKEYSLLTQNLNNLYELKRSLVEQNEQIGLEWMRMFYSIDNIFVLTGDLKASRNVLLSDMPAVFSNFQLFLPAVNRSRDAHRQELHERCLVVFEDQALRNGHKLEQNEQISKTMPLINADTVTSDSDKLLFACNNYEASYDALQNMMYDEEHLLQRFQTVYINTLNSIDNIRNQSTDIRFGITERIANNMADDASRLLKLIIFASIGVVVSILWVLFSAWYFFFLPTRRMSELIRDFNITYRIPDPREVPLKEMQVILANMRPTLMEVRSIKQKNKYLKELNTKLGQISYLDGLTQLHNRRALEEVIKRRPDLNNHSAVFMLDIDHFKLFNDSEGHQAGDEALRMVARTIKANLTHSKDMVYRYGGEEFCVILTCIDYKSTIELADRIVTSVENLHLRNSGINGYATISLGISYYAGAYAGDMDASIVQHIRWADAALYIAKRQGRNQCRIYKARNELFFEDNPNEARYFGEEQAVKHDKDWNEYHQQLTGDALATAHINNPNGANDIADTMALYSAMANNENIPEPGLQKNIEDEKLPSATVSKDSLKELERQEASLFQANQKVEAEQLALKQANAAAIAKANAMTKARGLTDHANQVANHVNHFTKEPHAQYDPPTAGMSMVAQPVLAGVGEDGGAMAAVASAAATAAAAARGLEHEHHHSEYNAGGHSHTEPAVPSAPVSAEHRSFGFDPIAKEHNDKLQLTPVNLHDSLKSTPHAALSTHTKDVVDGTSGHDSAIASKAASETKHVAQAVPAAHATNAGGASSAHQDTSHAGKVYVDGDVGTPQGQEVHSAHAAGIAGMVPTVVHSAVPNPSQGDVSNSQLAHPDVSSRLEVEPLAADHPISLLEQANQEQSQKSLAQLAQDQAALKQIQEDLPKAYDEDSDDFYSEDYEEDLIIPHMDEMEAEEDAVLSSDLPQPRHDSDFISIYYGDTPVNMDYGTESPKGKG